MPRLALTAVALAALLAGPPAAAQTWSGTAGTGSWALGGPAGNWSGAAAPAGGPATAVAFAGTSQLATTQDVATPLVLNALTFQPGAGAFIVGGGELRFGGATNALTQDAASNVAITAPVSFDGSGSIAGTGTGSLTLSGLHVRQGTLTVGRTVTVGGLTLGVEGGSAAAVSTGSSVLTLAGDVTFVRLTDPPDGFADAPPATLSGVVNLGGADRTFAGVYGNTTAGAAVDLAIHARLTGTGGFVKGGSLTDARSWMTLMGQKNYANGFDLTLHPHAVGLPLKWKAPQRIFVNSMSDLYHKDVPEEFILQVFDTMVRADWHQFQILTKRADRLEALSPRLPWADHIWQGVSVENARYAFRVDHLRRTGAKVKFLSIEPLLGPIPDLDLTGIDWVIVGGESGPGCRPMEIEWVMQLSDRCEASNVPMFFKQTGERLARQMRFKSKKGGDAKEWPAAWRKRQFPLPVVQ